MRTLLSALSGPVCIAAGLYLLLSQTADDSSYLQTIAHGIGIYFIGKGMFIIATLTRQSDQEDLARDQLDELRVISGRGHPVPPPDAPSATVTADSERR